MSGQTFTIRELAAYLGTNLEGIYSAMNAAGVGFRYEPVRWADGSHHSRPLPLTEEEAKRVMTVFHAWRAKHPKRKPRQRR